MIKIVFEKMPDDTVFHSTKGSITWKELKQKYKKAFSNPRIQEKLKKQGIRKIEIGSIAWFYHRKKTRGRFINLSTMFMARLLKR